jgi:hypothetical protein
MNYVLVFGLEEAIAQANAPLPPTNFYTEECSDYY